MMSSSGANNNGTTEEEPEPKRRRLLDAGGPVENDETARQKMRNAKVYEIKPDGTPGEVVGFDPDNVWDVKSYFPDDEGVKGAVTPMGHLARKGGLPMMRWLYVNGADTRDVDAAVFFPMFAAANRGELEACTWLFEHGAAKDIKRRTLYPIPNGLSPLHAAFRRKNSRNLSRWLILNGALCKDDDSGDLDVEIMKQDLNPKERLNDCVQERKALLEWANDLHRARTSFLLFLSGALSRPKHAYRTRQTVSPLQLLGGKSGILELIGGYIGFVRGREARIVRQLTEMLPSMIQELDGNSLLA